LPGLSLFLCEQASEIPRGIGRIFIGYLAKIYRSGARYKSLNFSRSMPSIKILLVSFSLSVGASAQTPTEKLTLAKQLVGMLDYSARFESFRQQCKAFKGSQFDPNTFVRDNPSAFQPITPHSKSWPKIETLYKAHQEKLCAAVRPESVNEMMVGNLAQELTIDDLKAAITFYSSDPGKRFNLANAKLAETLRRQIEKKFSDSAATAELLQALQAIFGEYALNPD
jgi:hypothetical protein